MGTGTPHQPPTLEEAFDKLQRKEARELIAEAGIDGDDRHFDGELGSLKKKQEEGSKKSRTKLTY